MQLFAWHWSDRSPRGGLALSEPPHCPQQRPSPLTFNLRLARSSVTSQAKAAAGATAAAAAAAAATKYFVLK